MLYFLHPYAAPQWSDLTLPRGTAADYLKPGTDTSRFAWMPAERPMTETFVRLALRFGYAVQGGVVVDAIDVADESNAQRLIESHAATVEAQNRLRATDSYKAVQHITGADPTWDARNDAEINDVVSRTIREFQAELADDLYKPIKASVAQHWIDLGGSIPEDDDTAS